MVRLSLTATKRTSDNFTDLFAMSFTINRNGIYSVKYKTVEKIHRLKELFVTGEPIVLPIFFSYFEKLLDEVKVFEVFESSDLPIMVH